MNWIVLIGFMGAGKSTIGKELAKELKLPFVDTDQLIEKNEGKTIRELFELLGESKFREIEAHTIRSLNTDAPMVVAVGGGLPIYENNMDFLNNNGLTIYLNHTPQLLVERLIHDRANRPLVEKQTATDLYTFVVQSIKEREAIYKKAKLIVQTKDQSLPVMLKLIQLYRE